MYSICCCFISPFFIFICLASLLSLPSRGKAAGRCSAEAHPAEKDKPPQQGALLPLLLLPLLLRCCLLLRVFLCPAPRSHASSRACTAASGEALCLLLLLLLLVSLLQYLAFLHRVYRQQMIQPCEYSCVGTAAEGEAMYLGLRLQQLLSRGVS